jgi:hypothetical protein
MVMRQPVLVFMLMVFSMSMAMADDKTINLDAIAGAYRLPLRIRIADDGLISQEDILEIVKESETSAYIRARLHFDNGHICAFWGIAEVQGSRLISHSSPESGATARSCTLILKMEGKDIVFDDLDHQCQTMWCGARGHFWGISLKRSSRQPITYLERIRASEQYREALKEYEQLHQSRLRKAAPPKRP